MQVFYAIWVFFSRSYLCCKASFYSSIKQPLCQIDDLDTLVIIFRYASTGNTSQNHIFLQFGKSNPLQRYSFFVNYARVCSLFLYYHSNIYLFLHIIYHSEYYVAQHKAGGKEYGWEIISVCGIQHKGYARRQGQKPDNKLPNNTRIEQTPACIVRRQTRYHANNQRRELHFTGILVFNHTQTCNHQYLQHSPDGVCYRCDGYRSQDVVWSRHTEPEEIRYHH